MSVQLMLQLSQQPDRMGHALQGPSMEQQLAPFGKVGAWMRRTQERTQPHFSAVHQMLHHATQNAIKWKGGMEGRSKL